MWKSVPSLKGTARRSRRSGGTSTFISSRVLGPHEICEPVMYEVGSPATDSRPG